MRMAADTASDRSISGDVREVFILVDPVWSVGADGKRFIESAITAPTKDQQRVRRGDAVRILSSNVSTVTGHR